MTRLLKYLATTAIAPPLLPVFVALLLLAACAGPFWAA